MARLALLYVRANPKHGQLLMKIAKYISEAIFFVLQKTDFQYFVIRKAKTPRQWWPVKTAIVCCCAYLLVGCANPIPPEGGPRDQAPPQLDSLRSTPNLQTRFQKQTIVLAFDEWVELRDVFTQVVVSPPLEKRPNVVRKKKTIEFEFDGDEVLRDSATYVINFGQAIRDLTEGNVAPIVFVFSTGDYIDSLSVEGNIVDAYTGKPVEKVLFMLYENLADSVLRKERPFYFAMTDKEGNFKVNNIKSGRFKAAALLDQNLNYRFDSDAERVAFLDSFLVLGAMPPTTDTSAAVPDSLAGDSLIVGRDTVARPSKPITPKVQLRLFAEDKPLFLQGKETGRYGVVKLGFNADPAAARIRFDSVGQQAVFFETEKDTVNIWYHLEKDTAWNVYVQRDTATDTVLVRAGLRDAFLRTAQLSTGMKTTGPPVRLAPGEPYFVLFNHPLASVDPTKLRLLEDTTQLAVLPQVRVDSAEKRKLIVDFAWKEGVQYEISLLPGCATDIFGLPSVDSVAQKITPGTAKDFGTLHLKVTELDTSQAYVIRLLGANDVPVKTFQVDGKPNFEATLPLLPPAAYVVEITVDLDRNGRWTTGSYDRHRQPEILMRKTLEQLRANWDLEAEVRLEAGELAD